jgi:hypothetical protein
MVWVVNATPRPFYPRERLGAHCIGGWVGSRAGPDGCGKSRPPTGIRSPDRPARNESLYRLGCRGSLDSVGKVLYFQANLAERTNLSCQAIGLPLCLTPSSGCRWLGVSFVRHRTPYSRGRGREFFVNCLSFLTASLLSVFLSDKRLASYTRNA